MSSPSRPTTACYRCREQKLKCSRDVPCCDRCSRLNIACQYPSPPDRKRLAKFRAPPRKRDGDEHVLSHGTESGRSNLSSSHEYYHDELSPSSEISLDNELPAELQHALQDTYFEYIFNASLLFHRPTFTLAFEKQCLPRYLLLATYAAATIVLSPESGAMVKHAAALQQLRDVKASGKSWAIRAGRDVLQNVDQPNLESIQTCIVLGLYWFSAGESLRNIMFAGIAYKAACALGMDRDGAKVISTVANALPGASSAWLQTELLRRVFWAVWLSQSLNGGHSATGSFSNDNVMNLSLPVSERAFARDIAEPSTTLFNIANRRDKNHSETSAPNPISIKAEATPLISFWSTVRRFIVTRPNKSRKEWLAELFELDIELQSWCSDLPLSIQYSKPNLYDQLFVNEQPDYIYLHAIYYQCRLTLHSSIVPQFSGVSAQDATSEVVTVSAQTAVRTAQKLSDLAADILALDWDLIKLAPFVGYCMYVPATIHIALFASKNPETVTLARRNLIPCLRVLDAMKTHWAHLQRLWVRVHVLYGAQMSQIRTDGSIQYGNITAQHLSSPGVPVDDLEELAGQTRKAGQLSEPLSDSVLQYTLSRLKPNATDSSLQELERSLHTDELAQLMDDELSRVRRRPEGSSNNRDNLLFTGPIAPAAATTSQDDSTNSNMVFAPTATTIPQPPVTATMPNIATLDPMQTDIADWWPTLNMESLQFPDLPYDYLFGFDFNT